MKAGLRWRSRLAAAHAGLSVCYLVWRIGWTFNVDQPIYATIFLLAEVSAVVASLVFYRIVSGRVDPEPPPSTDPPPTVDVLICTYNEEVALLRTTAVAARDMDGVHQTWLCDDGRRPEVAALAAELGIGYLTRPSNEHFKAGNLNAALAVTTGDLVLVLDADHVPRRQMAERLAAFFADPQLALVQTPQVYYNIDSYQHHVSPRGGRLWHEATVFHHMMQPGAARWNAAFFVGTGAMLRRSALLEIGGFATGSITEDIDTSMRLHARGWRSAYVDEALGFLLAPDTPLAYAGQRLRWAQGSMQILRRDGIRLARGLTWTQRIVYLNSLGGYLFAWQHALFYLAPALFLTAGMTPIAVDPNWGFPVFAARVAIDLFVYAVLGAPHARLFLGECYKMLTVAIFLRASFTLLSPEGLRFRVTPKGRHEGLPPIIVYPAAALFVFNLTAVGVGLLRLARGGEHPGALLLTTFFAALFGVASALALMHAWDRRGAHEHFSFPVELRAAPGVLVRRLNHEVAYALLDAPRPIGERVDLDLGVGRPVAARVGALEHGAEGLVARLVLDPLAPPERDKLDRLFFGVSVPMLLAGLRDAPVGPPPERLGSDGMSSGRLLAVRGGIV